MKKIFTFLAAAALIAGCSKTDEAQPSSYTITGYSTADTRTEFGAPGDDTIPFLWTKGDKVWVGSQQSDALAAGGESATFTLSSAPQDGDAVYYNMTGSGATASVPTAQDAANSLGANGDFGYATLSGNSFALEHATSYLWFDVTTTGFDATLLSVTVDAGDAAIAGSATWSGQAFGQVTDPTSTITLEVGANVAMPAMVVLPTAVSALTVTYEFLVDGVTKYYGQTLGAKSLAAGKTYKISATPSQSDLYELRTLTFEDADAKFAGYTLYGGAEINTWSDLVDDAQYGGSLTYTDYAEDTYYWYDEGNTELFHSFTTPYWGGGHVISNYVIEDYENLPAGYTSGWYELQMANPIGGHNGSANFAVHNGYSDFFNSQIYDASLQTLEFADGEEHVIDHMWVTNTNYVLNSLTYGDGFNSPATASTYVKVIAYGYNAANEETGSVEIYICKDGECLTEWAKWDLTPLGKVAKVAFNFAASEDQSGQFGLNCPAYFAYDDVTVRF
ncbi:MAG: DUF4465 domain-containing protein [Alistipes sp.]|nr:DUF4465 domain-containing protein [Alistipes sp.]